VSFISLAAYPDWLPQLLLAPDMVTSVHGNFGSSTLSIDKLSVLCALFCVRCELCVVTCALYLVPCAISMWFHVFDASGFVSVGRFEVGSDGKRKDIGIEGHSIVLATMGTFFLWFGWYGFNPGSTLAMSGGQHLVAGNATLTTSLAGCSGVIASILISHYLDGIHDLWHINNGLLASLVSITACAATVPPWAAIIIGILGCAAYRGASVLVSRAGIDDVVNAFALHGCGGAVGCLCAGIFSEQTLIDLAFGAGTLDYSPFKQFGVQLLGVVSLASMAAICTAIACVIAKYTVGLRVSADDEVVGLDFKYHAGYAYPDFNRKVKRAKQQIELERTLARKVRQEHRGGPNTAKVQNYTKGRENKYEIDS